MYHYNLHSKTILADRYTPVNAYIKVRNICPQSCLMESSDYHGEENSHSIIGFDPIAQISVNHGVATFNYPDRQIETKNICPDYTPQQAIADFMKQFKIDNDPQGYCGLYGYTAFDAIKYFEPIDVSDEP
ncbi:MAG: anthranilate synthase component I family protein, partial [Bacteroidaceae bacterium]